MTTTVTDTAPIAVVAAAASAAATVTDPASAPTMASDTAVAAPVLIPAIAGVQGVQVRSDDGNVLTTLDSGVNLQAAGRSADSSWLAVRTDAGPGWVETAQVIGYGLYKLPELALPAALADNAVEQVGLPEAQTVPDITAPASVTATLPIVDTQGDVTAATVAATAAMTPTTATVIADGRLNVRSGPGTDYKVVTKINKGDTVAVVGKNAAGDWLQIRLPTGVQDGGWLNAEFVQLNGTVTGLPVVTVAAPGPAAVATAVATTNRGCRQPACEHWPPGHTGLPAEPGRRNLPL